MSKKKRRSKPQTQPPEPVKPSNRKKMATIALAVATVCVLATTAYSLFVRSDTPSSPTANSSAVNTTRKAATLDSLLRMTPEQLAKVDIAEMNLLCATGLPGSESLDIDECLARLDKWAAHVKFETERHLYRLTDPRYKEHAEHYKHSEARFRAEWLVSVLQQDIGLH